LVNVSTSGDRACSRSFEGARNQPETPSDDGPFQRPQSAIRHDLVSPGRCSPPCAVMELGMSETSSTPSSALPREFVQAVPDLPVRSVAVGETTRRPHRLVVQLDEIPESISLCHSPEKAPPGDRGLPEAVTRRSCPLRYPQVLRFQAPAPQHALTWLIINNSESPEIDPCRSGAASIFDAGPTSIGWMRPSLRA